ncbi:MAG: polysaccharide pyruvyl transferase family protein, partial [Candidatus Margulisbacteria bacterium]|nr:polysaccharide pyruvyl transferase family protein [Candidatus Margulisiibacteriota bacterium]
MRVVISGYYGLDNIGDEAVLEAIVKGLRKHNPKIKITVLSATPATTEGALNLKAISRFAFLEIIRELKKADTFISGGGTLLQNSTSTKSFWYYLGLVWLAKFLKKKVMIFAQGFGPLTGQFNLALAKKVLNRVDVITLRDPESFDKVKKLGIDQPRVELTADPTFIFEPIAPPNYKPLVGISIRDFKGKTDQFYQDFAAFIDWLAQEFNFEPVFLLFQPQHDQAIIENITLHLKTKYEVLGTDYNA